MKCHLQLAGVLAALALAPATFADSITNMSAADAPFPVTITVDAAKPVGALTPIWRFFGADEADYAYLKNGKKLLSELGQLGGSQVYFRAHHLLTSGDGAYALKWSSSSAYKEDTNGTPVYDWSINDKIFDTYLERGVKPYVEIGFMPEALSTHPQNYPHNPPVNRMAPANAGQAYPPKDYAKWGELVYQWTKHCVEKYGAGEVNQWYWEVWNEPNISYWHGTREEFFKLHDYAVDGVRRALPTARVGGPETAGGPGGHFLRDFLNHCAPRHELRHRQNRHAAGFHFLPRQRLADVHQRPCPHGHGQRNCATLMTPSPWSHRFPNTSNRRWSSANPIRKAARPAQGPQDGYRNGTMYSSYTAASFPREFGNWPKIRREPAKAR